MLGSSTPGTHGAVAALLAALEMWPGTLLPLGLLVLKGAALAIGPRLFEFQAHEWAWCAVTTGIWGISTITVVGAARGSGDARTGGAATGPIVATLVAAVVFFVLIAGLETSTYSGHRAIAVMGGIVTWVLVVPSTAQRVTEARWNALSQSSG
ncbi:MAG: hypothetical protein FJX75_05795 [Armatimonadetes bacterium]|nr:hypothetical protein [Armatimonadota bacterium]